MSATLQGPPPGACRAARLKAERMALAAIVGLRPPPGSIFEPLQTLGRPTLPPATDGQEANALFSRYLFVAESFAQPQDDPCPEDIPLTARLIALGLRSL